MAKRPEEKQQGLTRRQSARARREARLQRIVIIGTALVGATVIGLLAYAIISEQIIKPRQPVFTLNDERVTISEFQQQVKFDYYLQTGGQSPEQLGVDPTFFGQLVLDSMINDMLVEHEAAERNITISEEDVQEEIELTFGFDAGEPEPTPTMLLTTSGPTATATATATFVYTPTPSPTATLEPGITPTVTLTPSPTSEGPTATPLPTQTPNPTPTSVEVTREDYEENYNQFVEQVASVTGLETPVIRELWRHRARLALLREHLMEQMTFEVDEIKEMVHAAHILTESQESALAALERINEGESFEVVAADVSLDTSNAYKGGDLGWFGTGRMVPEFEEVAFSLAEGEISGPVESQFGWHVIKVYEKEDVELTASELAQQRQEQFSERVNSWREESDLVIEDNWQQHMPDLP